MDNFEKAIGDLRKNYEKAVQMDFVINPVAYALYKTWKKYDKENTKNEV